ncbi:shikimate dehydrogenase [[Mycobacterium] wendilense]|uniref:Shikimate dehydrogenase n=1 Tax=[Mycobacterium] wendilense TaxID=3064284 RepID=A0ABM9MEN2_9MYCO|nr:shikimate dehydrogenase [Mycolicibacterium sp. MU0050]CAJ1583431.1 shikimate dehydrogenase [Mycolicibacterium sp. MU0050]
MPASAPTDPTARRAAVLGSPIAHSRSPQLHLAAYRALGLSNWTYERIECTAAQLPVLVGGFGPEWVGVSVTMPGKFAALQFADERTERAALVGSANTLVRTEAGWRADNTDIDGVVGALEPVLSGSGGRAILLGSGGTAPAAVVALARLGLGEVVVAARNAERAAELLTVAARVGLAARHCPLTDDALTMAADGAAVAVSTLPAEVAGERAAALAAVPVLLDALYDPWPTPLAAVVEAAGGTVVSGLQMLLHQAYSQVEQFTGRPAPRAQMAAALA